MKAITENTKINIGLVIVLVGGIVWLTSMRKDVDASASDISELKSAVMEIKSDVKEARDGVLELQIDQGILPPTARKRRK